MQCYDHESDSILAGAELDQIIKNGEISPCFIKELPNYQATKIVYVGRTYRLVVGISEILEHRKVLKFRDEMLTEKF